MGKKGNRKKSNRGGNKLIKVGAILGLIAITIFIILQITNSNTTETSNSAVKNFSAFEFTKHGELTFNSQEGEVKMKIDIEIADDDKERGQGLMYRDEMREDRGMFFIFPEERLQSFWMRNTQLSLDMLFVNSKNEVVTIHKSTTPFSEQSYPSTAPAVYVVEVNTGFTDKFNIQSGDKIVWRRN